MQRGMCIFNKSLQKKYPFIEKQKNKTDSDVCCKICSSNICIANGGISNIRRHIMSGKHQRALRKSTDSQSHPETSESIFIIDTQKKKNQGTSTSMFNTKSGYFNRSQKCS